MEVTIETSETLRGYPALLAAEHVGSGKDFHEGFDLALDLDLSDEDCKAVVFGYGPNQWASGRDTFKSSLLNYHLSMLEF